MSSSPRPGHAAAAVVEGSVQGSPPALQVREVHVGAGMLQEEARHTRDAARCKALAPASFKRSTGVSLSRSSSATAATSFAEAASHSDGLLLSAIGETKTTQQHL